MAQKIDDTPAAARDGFERYYTEKIWDWIPAVYKHEDGLAAPPDVLRSIVQVLARQAAIARRSIDRLWDDTLIELCDDWAIAYLGDLVGTRLVNELNRRGRRTDVARTIFYRRRNGTPLVLEILIRDIAEWEGVLVESFRRLARTRHGLDPEPAGLEGLVTGTPPGGWARLTSTRGAELVDGPFDEFAHTPDFRQRRGHLGRYNIPKLNFHLFRQLPFELRFATPGVPGKGRFTFDPSCRDIPLFRPDQRPDPPQWHPPREWELPAPIPCRLLGEARYVITVGLIDELIDRGLSQPAADALARYAGIPFRNEARLRETLESLDGSAAILGMFGELLRGAITDDSPKAHLLPGAVAVAVGADNSAPPVESQQVAAGNLEDWGASLAMLSPEKNLVIDPERGRFWFRTPPSDKVWVPIYHYGLLGEIGAGTYDRRHTIATDDHELPNGGESDPGPVTFTVPSSPPRSRVFKFQDSKSYEPDADMTGITEVTVQAANRERPYLLAKTEWLFGAQPREPDPTDPATNFRALTLDGLWIGIEQEGASPVPAPCQPVPAALILDGDFDCVTIRHCTLDPGGEKARIEPDQCQAIPYVRLMVRGNVEELVVESSIVGPIIEDRTDDNSGVIRRLIIRDSIVHAIDTADRIAIQAELGTVEMKRVTVFGDVIVNRLFASEALIQGLVCVTDNQHGCFSFSATNEDPQKRLPPQFESHLFAPAIPNYFFVSRQFGDPGYAQFSDSAPQDLVCGAENRSEIGAYSSLLGAIKLDDLVAKINEFMPFGLIAQPINET